VPVAFWAQRLCNWSLQECGNRALGDMDLLQRAGGRAGWCWVQGVIATVPQPFNELSTQQERKQGAEEGKEQQRPHTHSHERHTLMRVHTPSCVLTPSCVHTLHLHTHLHTYMCPRVHTHPHTHKPSCKLRPSCVHTPHRRTHTLTCAPTVSACESTYGCSHPHTDVQTPASKSDTYILCVHPDPLRPSPTLK
jgi:hypothetical protein